MLVAASCGMAAAIQFGVPALAGPIDLDRYCIEFPSGVYDLAGRDLYRDELYCFEDKLDRSYFLLEYFLSESGIEETEVLRIIGEIQAVESEIREFIDPNRMADSIDEYIQNYQAATLIQLADEYLFPEGFDPTGVLQEAIPVNVEEIEPLVNAALDGSFEQIGLELLTAAGPTMTSNIDAAMQEYLQNHLGQVVDAEMLAGLTNAIAPVIQGDIDGLLASGVLGGQFDALLNERLSEQLSGVLGDSVAGELSSSISQLLQGGDIQQVLASNASGLVREHLSQVVFDSVLEGLGDKIGTVLDSSVLSGLDGVLNDALGHNLTGLLGGVAIAVGRVDSRYDHLDGANTGCRCAVCQYSVWGLVGTSFRSDCRTVWAGEHRGGDWS